MDCFELPEALFKWNHPFDIRESLEGPAGPVTTGDLGCFMTAMWGAVRVEKQSEFWDLARRTHHEIQFFVQHRGPALGYLLARFAQGKDRAMARFFKRRRPKLKPPRNRHDTLLVTHYGVLDIKEEYGSLRPRECTLISNNAIAGPPLIIEGLILGQRLNIGFAADDLEPSFWDQLQGAVRGRLEAAMCAAA